LSKLNDLGICSNDQAGRLFEALKPDISNHQPSIDFKTFHSGLQNITSGGAKSIETQQGAITASLPPRRTILQPLDSGMFRQCSIFFKADMREKQFTHDTKGIIQADQNTNMFMATRDRFDRTAGHREACVREDRERKERLLKEKVYNKSKVLTMYEDLKSRSEWKHQQRESQNILVQQQRKQIYDEVVMTYQ
jgi:hypothetical protein